MLPALEQTKMSCHDEQAQVIACSYAVLRNGLIRPMPMPPSSSPSGCLTQRIGRELSKPPVSAARRRRSAIGDGEGTFAGPRGNDKVAP